MKDLKSKEINVTFKYVEIGGKYYPYDDLKDLMVDLRVSKVKIKTEHLKDWLISHNIIKKASMFKEHYKRGKNYEPFKAEIFKHKP